MSNQECVREGKEELWFRFHFLTYNNGLLLKM